MNDSPTIHSSSVDEIYEDYYCINNCHLFVFFFFTNMYVFVDLIVRTGGVEPSLVIILRELLILVILLY